MENRKEASRLYYLKAKQNPQYIEKKRQRYLAQADKISKESKERRAKYRLLHPIIRKTVEEKKAKERAWRVANKERLSANHREWVAKNNEKMKEYHREYNKVWYGQNKEERQKQIRAYSKAHPKENVVRTQRYVKKFPEKVKDYNKRFNQTIIGKYRYTLVRSKKWTSLPITIEEFGLFVILPCVYCGESEKNRGIDRIDNTLGYTKENSAPCCKICNHMKKTMTVEEFINHVKKIAEHNK